MKKEKIFTLAGIGTGLLGVGVAVAAKLLGGKEEDSYSDIYGGDDDLTDEEKEYDEFWEDAISEYGDEDGFGEHISGVADQCGVDPLDYIKYLANTIRIERTSDYSYLYADDDTLGYDPEEEYDPDADYNFYSEEDDEEDYEDLESRYYEEPEEDPYDIALDIQRATYIYNKLFKKR